MTEDLCKSSVLYQLSTMMVGFTYVELPLPLNSFKTFGCICDPCGMKARFDSTHIVLIHLYKQFNGPIYRGRKRS